MNISSGRPWSLPLPTPLLLQPPPSFLPPQHTQLASPQFPDPRRKLDARGRSPHQVGDAGGPEGRKRGTRARLALALSQGRVTGPLPGGWLPAVSLLVH